MYIFICIYLDLYIHTYIYISVRVCVCLCVYISPPPLAAPPPAADLFTPPPFTAGAHALDATAHGRKRPVVAPRLLRRDGTGRRDGNRRRDENRRRGEKDKSRRGGRRRHEKRRGDGNRRPPFDARVRRPARGLRVARTRVRSRRAPAAHTRGGAVLLASLGRHVLDYVNHFFRYCLLLCFVVSVLTFFLFFLFFSLFIRVGGCSGLGLTEGRRCAACFIWQARSRLCLALQFLCVQG